jgi:bacteriorhodopsin
MGCVAMFYVFWVIYGPGLKSAAHLGDDFKKAYLYSSLLLTVLWTLYPVSRISGRPAPFPQRAARTSTNHHTFIFYSLFFLFHHLF